MYNFSEYSKVYIREQYYNDEIFPGWMRVKNGNDQVALLLDVDQTMLSAVAENHKTSVVGF